MPATQSCKSQHTSITQMKCEYQQSPLGIDMEHPRFTWQYAGDTAWHQASYQLLLADESLNITEDVIKGLNKRYKSEKGAKKDAKEAKPAEKKQESKK